MAVRRNELSRKIERACDLHIAEMEGFSRERQRAASTMMKGAGELFAASALYVAIVVMWFAIALRLV